MTDSEKLRYLQDDVRKLNKRVKDELEAAQKHFEAAQLRLSIAESRAALLRDFMEQSKDLMK